MTQSDIEFLLNSSILITSLYFRGILKDVGITKKSKLIEVQRPDLVGRYLGETALQTKTRIERTKDGVLFVDEAYRLKVDSDKDYGKEALDTLMEAMLGENPVIIFAGYPAQMENFIKLNPGFKRRIRSIFHFQDYTCAELAEVFMLKVASRVTFLWQNLQMYWLRKPQGILQRIGKLDSVTACSRWPRKILMKDYLLIICP